MRHAIYPGQVWLDTDGQRIQAHGGSIFYENDTFYWYGENKERTAPGNGIWHWGVRLYSSKDLYNWKSEGIILPPSDDPSSPLHPSKHVDRPHIIYNKRTRKYVMWVKIMDRLYDTDEPISQFMSVCVADSITGPFTFVHALHPLGMNSGDFDLVVEPTDGKAYIYFERVHTELICADLSDDYLTVTGYYTSHFPRRQPPFVREAPAHFFRRGTHYLFTSGTTSYYPNPSEIASSDMYHGPWVCLGDPHIGDERHTSFDTQITSVFRHPKKKDLYIALADRWLTDLPDERPDIAGWFERMFNPDLEPLTGDPFRGVSAVNTSLADYVWLPVRFDRDRPTLVWMDEWRVEDYE